MASIRELESFVTKFKHLLHNGFEATLSLESKRGKAFVVLKAEIDPIPALRQTYVTPCSPLHPNQKSSIQNRYRSPSYRRRQERRRLARGNSVHAAEEANDQVTAEEANDQSLVNSPECSTAESQAEIFAASKAQFEVKIAAQKDVKPYDILEALDENFEGGLGDRNVETTSSQNMYVHQICEKVETTENSDGFEDFTFRIFVNNDENAIDVIQNWRNPGQFDDLAFRNASSDKRQVRVKEVKKLW